MSIRPRLKASHGYKGPIAIDPVSRSSPDVHRGHENNCTTGRRLVRLGYRGVKDRPGVEPQVRGAIA